MVRPIRFGSVMTASSGTSTHSIGRFVGNVHAIVPIVALPVGIRNRAAVGVRAASAPCRSASYSNDAFISGLELANRPRSRAWLNDDTTAIDSTAQVARIDILQREAL